MHAFRFFLRNGILVTIKLFLLSTIILSSCDSNVAKPPYQPPTQEFIFYTTWDDVYDEYLDFNDLDIEVFMYEYGVFIKAISPFEIETCELYIDNVQIDLSSPVDIIYFSYYRFFPGESYYISLSINGIIYELDFTIPYKAIINLPDHQFENELDYTFTWVLESSNDVQFVGCVVDRVDVTEVPSGFLVDILLSSIRSYTVRTTTITSQYRCTGIFVHGFHYIKKERILFYSEVNSILLFDL